MRYLMRKQMFAIADDFWVEDDQGRPVFKVDGKALPVRQTFVLEDATGAEVATIRKQLLRARESMAVERGGQQIGRIRRALFAPFRQRFDVDLAGGSHLMIYGNFAEHEYEVRRGRSTVAEISKRWFALRDSYAVDVGPDEDVALMLAITVAVDWMEHGAQEPIGWPPLAR